ncbi:hypothetical protein [Acinetobacter proteolyticus]|nr:hypothetical protein [Acinetobacter proteolyticus]
MPSMQNDINFWALIDCGQDESGIPFYNCETCKPKLRIQGYDVEEFTGGITGNDECLKSTVKSG